MCVCVCVNYAFVLMFTADMAKYIHSLVADYAYDAACKFQKQTQMTCLDCGQLGHIDEECNDVNRLHLKVTVINHECGFPVVMLYMLVGRGLGRQRGLFAHLPFHFP